MILSLARLNNGPTDSLVIIPFSIIIIAESLPLLCCPFLTADGWLRNLENYKKELILMSSNVPDNKLLCITVLLLFSTKILLVVGKKTYMP